MQIFFQEYLKNFQACHSDILKTLNGLSPSALDWSPGQEMNSISVLVFHLTGAERYWIGDVVMRESSDRDRDAEFKIQHVGMDILQKRLNDNLAYANYALEKLQLTDLEANRTSPRDGREYTVAWSLMHALEHSTLHLGQIQLTRQLWEQKEQAS